MTSQGQFAFDGVDALSFAEPFYAQAAQVRPVCAPSSFPGQHQQRDRSATGWCGIGKAGLLLPLGGTIGHAGNEGFSHGSDRANSGYAIDISRARDTMGYVRCLCQGGAYGTRCCFQSKQGQAIRLPKAVALPDDVKRVDVIALGRTSIIAPAGELWDSWFDSPAVTADFIHARSRGLVIVTNNRREFDRVPGLRVEDWVTEP